MPCATFNLGPGVLIALVYVLSRSQSRTSATVPHICPDTGSLLILFNQQRTTAKHHQAELAQALAPEVLAPPVRKSVIPRTMAGKNMGRGAFFPRKRLRTSVHSLGLPSPSSTGAAPSPSAFS